MLDAAGHRLDGPRQLLPGDFADQVDGKAVVAGGHGRVGGEDAEVAHGGVVRGAGGGQATAAHGLSQQGQRKQGRVALVHVICVEPVVAQGAQDGDAAKAQQHLLGQTVAFVAAVELARERLIAGVVFGQGGVEEIDGHGPAGDAAHEVAPGLQCDGPPFDLYRDAQVERLEEVAGLPGVGLLELVAVRLKVLTEVALAVEERHRDHRHAQVGGRPQGVAREHAEAAAIGRHGGIEAGFHREVGNAGGREEALGHRRALTVLLQLSVSGR